MSVNGFYDLTPIYPPSFVGRNLSFVTGFTHRTNITYLELLMELYKWLRDTHIPEIDKVLEDFRDKYENDFKNLKDDIDGTKTEWQKLFDDFMTNIVKELEALNDQAMANLISSKLSATRSALDNVYLKADNKTVRITEHVYDGVVRDHFVVKIANATSHRNSVLHLTGNDSLDAESAPTESISSYRSRTGANVVINGGGIWPTGRRVGLIIKDGILIQDWEPLPQTDWGVEAFVFFKDGTVKICTRSEASGQELIEQGAWNSVSFGKAAIKNGADMGLRSDPKYTGVTGRQCIGTNIYGEIVVITFPGKSGDYGATIQDVYNVAETNLVNNLYMLDGGGSTQLNYNGVSLVRSSDAGGSREVADALAFFGNDANPPAIDANLMSIPLEENTTTDPYKVLPITGDKNTTNDVRVRRVGRQYEVMVRIGVTGAPNGKILGRLPRQIMWPSGLKQYHAGSNNGIVGNLNVNEYGHLIFMTKDTAYTPALQVRAEFTMIL